MNRDSSSRTHRAPLVVGAVFALLVALGAVLVAGHRPARPAAPAAVRALAIVPAGPALVASVDVARLRKTHAGAAFVAKGLAELTHEPCENALLAEIDELAVALPSDTAGDAASSEAFALIATGRFTAEKLSACAEARIRARRGDAVKTTLGSFTSVRDPSRSGELAVRDGLFVLSNGSYLRKLVDAADGHRTDGTPAERQRDALHVELRRSVGQGAPVIATLVLPPGWLSRTLSDETAEASPLAAIRSAALRADATADMDVAGVVGCETPDACDRLERFADNARADLATFDPSAAELLSRVHFTRTGARLAFEAHFAEAELERAWAQRGRAGAADAPAAGATDAGADAAPPQSHGP